MIAPALPAGAPAAPTVPPLAGPSSRVALRALALSAPLLLLGGCGEAEVASAWRDREVVLDGMHGENGEWRGALTELEGTKASLGLLNDDEALWVALFVRAPGLQRQILGGGSTVWFDPGGGDDRGFGLRLPADPALPRRASRDRSEHRPPLHESGAGGDRVVDVTAVGLRTGTEPADERPVALADAPGLGFAERIVDGTLAIEMRLPFGDPATAPLALATRAGDAITIGLEARTPEMPGGRPPGRPDGADGPSAGGPPPGGSGRDGGFGGGPPRGGFARPEPYDRWVKVKLAAGPAATR